MTARVLLMDGEEGGVAVASRLRPELEGGDVEGTVRLTTGESSPSPVRGQRKPTRHVSGMHSVILVVSCALPITLTTASHVGGCPHSSWPNLDFPTPSASSPLN